MKAVPGAQSSIRYRPDIDGLRAVAVLLVVFCHLGIRGVDGGYIGVDVFFVISGYLISGILLREIPAGAFSFATFYERRVRRIAPALLATFLLVLYLAQRYDFPAGLYDLASSMLAALLSASNFFFMQFWKYFDPENQSRPLLHTWSLAVEEQYYLVFPVLLVAIHRWWPRFRKPIVWLLAALSFVAACLQMHYSYGQYTVAFFLSPLRAWEFLVGTILYDLPRARAAWQRNLMSAAGLLSILLAAHFYGPLTEFPGMTALAPCLGAALIIAAGESGDSFTARLLSLRPVRFIGTISYSLYLVHWPILLFQRDSEILVNAEHHPRWVNPAVLGVSLLAATFSWRFIEMPFRQGRFRPSRRQLYSIVGPLAAALLIACGLLLHTSGWGIPHLAFTYTQPSRRFAEFHLHLGEGKPGSCYVVDNFAAYKPSTCLTEDPHRQNWVLFGDSHSGSIYDGLHKAYPDVNISRATITGCWPVVKTSKWVSRSCNEMTSLVFRDYVLHHHVDALILVLRWGWWMKTDLSETLAFLKQHNVKVFVVGPSTEYTASLPRLILLAERTHDPEVYSAHRSADTENYDKTMVWLAQHEWKVPYISMYADLCHPDPASPDPPWQVRTVAGCPIFAAEHIPLLLDDNHLTPEGALVFADAIKARHELP